MTAFSTFSTPDLQLIRFCLDLTKNKFAKVLRGEAPQSVISAQEPPDQYADALFQKVLIPSNLRLEELIKAIDDEAGKRSD